MDRTRAAAAAAIVVALALPATGCGGDDSEAFRDDYNAAVERLSKINRDIGEAGDGAGRTNREIAREFNRIANSAERTRTDLAALEPPEEAKDEFDNLLAALATGVEDLRTLADAATSGSPQTVSKAVAALSASGQKITQAESALKSAVDG